MRILALERELAPSAAPAELLRREALEVWALQKQGVIRDIWFTSPGRNAVVMLECLNALEARRHLASLPLVRSGLIDFTLLELCPYDGFERLTVSSPVDPAKPVDPPEY